MSRCFPFPPPGYEKKARTDGVDILKKDILIEKGVIREKDREKKHKKEKKNREQREGKDKERRDKDRSEGKHREKKEKKEKHREKKEDRDNDKDKNNALDEKRLTGQPVRINGVKASDEKKVPGKFEVNSGDMVLQKGKEKDRNSISGEKKFPGQFSSFSERISQNSHLAEQKTEPKFVKEVDRRIRYEAGGTAKQLVDRFTSPDARKDEGMVRLVARPTGILDDGKEKTNKCDDRKLDGLGIRDGSRSPGNSMPQSLRGIVQPRTDRMPIPPEKEIEKRIEGKEKSKQKEDGDKLGDKRKDKDKEKEGQGKDKTRDKEKKKEKLKEKGEHKNTEPDKLKESNKNGLHNANTTHLLKKSTNSAVSEENLRKRKDSDANGFLSATDIKPSKVPRPTPLHPLMENGKILVTSQSSSSLISGRLGTVNNHKADAKECKINGVIEPQALPVSTTQSLSTFTTSVLTTAQTDQIAEVSRKQPHPDLKYLSEVFTVPKTEEWSNCKDQEWLFQVNDFQPKKPKVGSLGVDETPLVWSEALRIESADVCALPYVIPY